ncbi:MAG: DUF5005 domain-containing protein [Bacteroidales bacterium]|nr:DUF5005 domain-containing protein [Bacteroidales bacterium]MBN2699025.1 DUF5005 domain-containing protein [Bacteroidales bacterium]
MMMRTITTILLIALPLSLEAIDPDTAFNRLFRQDIGGWIAADATYSIHLPDGRTLWLFGDTFIGEVEGVAIRNGSAFIRNSAVIQENSELMTLHGGTPEAPDDFIKTDNPDSTWYWPEHGIVDRDTLRILLGKFRHEDNGTPGFDFAQAGNDIASFSWPDLEFIRTEPVMAHAINGVTYGDRVLTDSDTIYIYGRRSDTASYNIPYPHVARTTGGNFMNQAAWEFFDGSGWSPDPEDSRRIHDFQVSQQYSVSTYRGKYILLTQDIWLSPDIYTFVSDSPVGPWRNKTKIYTTPETGGTTFTYNAWAHPQFNKQNELLVSYNVNGDFWSIFSNVELYRPRFIRVPYMNLSYEFWPNQIEDLPRRETEIRVWPNPAGNYTKLIVKAAPGSTISWQLMDGMGRLIDNRTGKLTAGEVNEFPIPLEDLADGIYYLRFSGLHRQETLRIIKSSNY